MNYWFTSDEHYGHENVIKFNNRPFENIHEMNDGLIKRHNEVVNKGDVVIHAGDFCWKNNEKGAKEFLDRLNGTHILLKGSHDNWMNRSYHEMWTKTINKQLVVVCHYAMRVWPRRHYGSWMLYGHSHGKLPDHGYSTDIGVDNWDYYPVSWDQIVELMKNKPAEPNRCTECKQIILERK